MPAPGIRKKKLKVRLGFPIETAPTPFSSLFGPLPAQIIPAVPAVPALATEPSIFDFTFEDYKAAGLNINEQHDLIGKIREEVALIDRDEVDGLLLEDMGKQLQICIFATCKMMHIDPAAVKRMLGGEFRKAYGVEVDDEIKMKEEMGVQDTKDGVNEGVGGDGGEWQDVDEREEESYVVVDSAVTASAPPVEPPSKKVKRAQPSAVQKEIKAYEVKSRRGHRKVLVLTLRSKSVAEKWASLSSGK